MADFKALMKDLAGADWTSLSPKEQDDAERYYKANPNEFEKLLLDQTGDLLHEQEAKQPGTIRGLVSAYVGSEDTLGAIPAAIPSMVLETVKGAAGALTPLGITSPYQMASEIADYNRPYLQPGVTQTAFDVASTVGQNLGVIGGVAGLSALGAIQPETIPVAAAGIMALIKGGDVAAQHIEQGGTKLGAAAKGLASGAAAGILERVSLGAGLSGLPGSTIGMMMREPITEVAEEGVDIGLDYLTGTGGPTDAGSITRRLGNTALVSTIATPFLGAGSALIGAGVNRINTEKMIQEIQQREATEAAETDLLQQDLEAPPPEADIEFIDEQVEAPLATSFKIDPEVEIGDDSGETFNMAATPTTPADMSVGDTIDSAGKRVFYPGDQIFIKAKLNTKLKKPSTALGDRSIPGLPEALRAEVLGMNDDGTISVQVEGTTDPSSIEADTVISKAVMGPRGMDIQIDPAAPNAWSLLQVNKDFAQQALGHLKTTLKTKPGQLAFVTIDKKTGRTVKIGYDWAIQRYPGTAQVALAHELGHSLSMSDPTKVSNNIHGKLVREYRSSKNFVLMEPVTKNPHFDSMKQMHENARQRILAEYAGLGKKWDMAAGQRLQRAWDGIMANEGLKGLSDVERTTIREQVGKDVTAEMNKIGLPRAERNKYRNAVTESRLKDALDKAYADKGMFYLPTLRTELEAVHAVMRGLTPNKATRKMLYDMHPENQVAEEMYADLFTAKVLGLQVRLKGQYVDLMSTYAPNLNKQFDAYIDQNPNFVKTLKAATEYTNDVNKVYQTSLEAMQKQDKRDAEIRAEKNPEFAWLVSKYGPVGGMLRGARYKFFNGIFDANFTAYDNVNPEVKLQLREKIEQLNGLSAIMQDFLEKTNSMFQPVFQEIKNSDPSAKPEETLGMYMMYRRIAAGERGKKLDYSYIDASGNKQQVVVDLDLVNGEFPMEPSVAKSILENADIFKKHGESLDKAFNAFQEFWSDNIIEQLYRDQMIDQGFYEALKKNKNYATYAVVKDFEQKPMFKTVAPTIKEMMGAASSPRNPLGATLEHGMALSFMSRLNTIKRILVQNIPDDPQIKREVKPVNRLFPEPRDKVNFSLVTYKSGGKDFGYHVPKMFVEGIEYGGGTGKLNSLIVAMAKTRPYFRKVLTTWRPDFIARNMIKDFQRMFVNAENPETGGSGFGIISEWVGVLRDHFTPAGQERLTTELSDLRNQALVLSDYDFGLRDASFDNVYEALQQSYSQTARDYRSDDGKKKRFLATLIPRMISGLETISRAAERIPKRAAARYYKSALSKGVITRDEYNQLVRKTGSPYFLNKGSWHPMTGAMAMFFNPAAQALYEDISRASQSPAVFAKRGLILGASLAFQTALMESLITSGSAGDEWADMLKRIPWRDLDNNICIPFGLTPSGKSIYLKIPLDENTASLKKIARAFMNDPKTFATWMTPITEASDVSLNPFLATLLDVGMYMRNVNPPNYLGNPTVNKDAWDAGGSYTFKEFAKQMYNRWSPTTPIYRFTYSDPRSEAKGGKPENEMQQIAAWMEQGMDIPLAQTLLKTGMIGVSDGGVHDEFRHATAENTKYRASLRIEFKNLNNGVIIEDKGQIDAAMETLRKMEPVTPEQAIILKGMWENFPTMLKNSAGSLVNPWLSKFSTLDEADKLSVLQNKSIMGAMDNE